MTGMVTYLPPARAGALHGDRLWRGLRADHAVELAVSPWASPGGVMMRVSTAWFNGEDEVDALVATLKDLDWSKYR
jgi:selenocysteine lyase/cysteine desulfurase